MVTQIPELGRFAEPALLILVSLSDGPKHGYAIMADVEAGTGRPLGPGTLYAALARLEERGLIEALAPVDRRRPYRLTAVGATSSPSSSATSPSSRSSASAGSAGRPADGDASHDRPAAPPLSGALAGPLRRRVRRGARGATARPVRRGRRPARRARRPPASPRPRRRVPTRKGVRHVTPHRGATPPSSAASCGSSSSPANAINDGADARRHPVSWIGSVDRRRRRRHPRRPRRAERVPGASVPRLDLGRVRHPGPAAGWSPCWGGWPSPSTATATPRCSPASVVGRSRCSA